MTKPKLDSVQLAKSISKLTRVPLPRVAAVMQKYPLDGPGVKKAREECEKLGAEQLHKDLVAMGLI
jgi:hypothetical protein